MVVSNVYVSKINTMADGGLRVTLDLLPGSREEIAELFDLKTKEEDTRMYIGNVSEFNSIQNEQS